MYVPYTEHLFLSRACPVPSSPVSPCIAHPPRPRLSVSVSVSVCICLCLCLYVSVSLSVSVSVSVSASTGHPQPTRGVRVFARRPSSLLMYSCRLEFPDCLVIFSYFRLQIYVYLYRLYAVCDWMLCVLYIQIQPYNEMRSHSQSQSHHITSRHVSCSHFGSSSARA